MDLEKYIYEFEKNVMIQGYELEWFGDRKKEPVPLNNGKLINTKFGKLIKGIFIHSNILAFDYYGLFKLSSNIIEVYEEHKDIFPGIKIINSPVIHFSSIKREQVEILSPSLLNDFDKFKNELVKLRW